MFIGTFLLLTVLSSVSVGTPQYEYRYHEHGFVRKIKIGDDTTVCDGDLYNSSGVVTSPGWPSNYQHNISCYMIIHADHADAILLNFTHFNLERSTDCQFDYLEIRNGHGRRGILVGRYCGHERPPLLYVSPPPARVRFSSDNTDSYSGFMFQWTSVELTGPVSEITAQTEEVRYLYNYTNNGGRTELPEEEEEKEGEEGGYNKNTGLGVGAVAGIVVSVVVLILLTITAYIISRDSRAWVVIQTTIADFKKRKGDRDAIVNAVYDSNNVNIENKAPETRDEVDSKPTDTTQDDH